LLAFAMVSNLRVGTKLRIVIGPLGAAAQSEIQTGQKAMLAKP
jgi:hypothetical protein